MLIIIIIKVKYNYYSEIITIQLTSYVNLKPVNWNFVNNQLTVWLNVFYTFNVNCGDCSIDLLDT